MLIFSQHYYQRLSVLCNDDIQQKYCQIWIRIVELIGTDSDRNCSIIL